MGTLINWDDLLGTTVPHTMQLVVHATLSSIVESLICVRDWTRCVMQLQTHYFNVRLFHPILSTESVVLHKSVYKYAVFFS